MNQGNHLVYNNTTSSYTVHSTHQVGDMRNQTFLVPLLATRILLISVLATASTPLPLHLAQGFRPNITLRGAVLHSHPFAIVEENEETGALSARGLQMDLLQRLAMFAAEDGVSLHFDLEPWQYSPQHTYSTAVDLIASDCPLRLNQTNTSSIISHYGCNSFDIIIADLWRTPERFLRVDMTPAWLVNAISAMKYVGPTHERRLLGTGQHNKQHITTLTEASKAQATVCVLKDTHSSRVVMDKFPEGIYYQCQTDDECFDHLQDGSCVLFSRDELFLKAKEFEQPGLFQTTRERFNAQYVVWPLRWDLDPTVSYLVKRWITRAVSNNTMDELYHKYFEAETCPIGTAGEQCEKPCDPVHGTSDSRGHCLCESTRFTGGKKK
jgi:Bacterial extracellular solute-binding proteins, family 3